MVFILVFITVEFINCPRHSLSHQLFKPRLIRKLQLAEYKIHFHQHPYLISYDRQSVWSPRNFLVSSGLYITYRFRPRHQSMMASLINLLEYTVLQDCAHGRVQHILQLNNVRFQPSVKAMYITFQCYKHSTGRPFSSFSLVVQCHVKCSQPF